MAKQKAAPASKAWTTLQVFVFAVVCLAAGVALGYLLRGLSQPVVAEAPPAAPPPMAPTQMPVPSERVMRSVADKRAEPLLAQLKKHPKDAKLLAEIGNIYYDTHNFKEAISYYQRSIAIHDSPDVHADMANSYWYAGDADTAIREFENVLKIDPKHVNANVNLGLLKWRAKMDPNGAVAAWEKLLQVNPDFPEKERVLMMIAEVKQQANVQAQATK